jgi:hypothetical protein
VLWILVALILAASPAWAGQLDASWTAPATRTDGTALDPATLTYRVYWFLFPNTPCPGTQFLVTGPGVTAAHLPNLTQGMSYNVQATAVDTSGNESACSNVATAVARADTGAPVPGTNLTVTFLATPPPPPTGFTVNGLTAGQVVTGLLRVSAVPTSGSTTNQHFRFDLLNSLGVSVSGNDEFGTPYCFVGDPGALPCLAFDTSTVPIGAYSMKIVYTPPTGSPTTSVIPFTISR